MRRRAAAPRYEISESVAIKWLERIERHGSREPVGHGGHRASKLVPTVIFAGCADREDGHHAFHAVRSPFVQARRQIRHLDDEPLLSPSGRHVKKDACRARAGPPGHKPPSRWRAYQGRIDPRRLVFIDETWTKTNMTRVRGWAPKGQRLVDKVPHGRWKTATFLAALRNDRIDAPCLFDGPINGQRFRAYVEQFLTPMLRPGDVVILDNLGSHKGKAVRQAIRAVGARLVFLPKYSPDLNPIERSSPNSRLCCERPKPEHTTLSPMQAQPPPRSIPARRMRRPCEERRICVNPNADR
jgi:putative transposase